MRYLNNAGTSWPKPPDVAKAVADVHAATPDRRAALFDAAHAAVCRFFNVTQPERLLLTSGCTSALSVAIGDLPWRPGDRIVTSALEHHALARPATKLALERGVIHTQIPRADDGPLDLARLANLLAEGDVRLVAITHASNVTGELLPVTEVAALAHAHGALLLVDAAQTAGSIPIDTEALGADVVVFAGHKHLLGPQGIGGLWAKPGVTFASPWASCEVGSRSGRTPRRPMLAGGPEAQRHPGGETLGGSPEHLNGFPPAAPQCHPMPGYCDVGSVNLAGAVGLAAALDWITLRGVEETGGRARRLATRLVAGVAERDGVALLGGEGPRTATVSLRVEGLALAEAEGRFRAEGLGVRAGQHCAPLACEALGQPAGTLRISFGPFNGVDDVEQVLAVLDKLRA